MPHWSCSAGTARGCVVATGERSALGRIGQSLRFSYTVAAGDTLSKIAAKL